MADKRKKKKKHSKEIDYSATDEDLPARVAVCRQLSMAFRHMAEWCGNIAKDFEQLEKAFDPEAEEGGAIQ